MGADQSIDNAQTKSGPTRGCPASRRVAAPESFEDARVVLRRDAGAFVGDPDLGPRAITPHAHPGRGSGWSMRPHVGEQVVNSLTQGDCSDLG